MLAFYKKAVLVLLGVVTASALVCVVTFKLYYIEHKLQPSHKAAIPWHLVTTTDVDLGGGSVVSVTESRRHLEYTYRIRDDIAYPYVQHYLVFDELESATYFVDLSVYDAVSFRAQCSSANVMTFHVHTFDDVVTDINQPASFRLAIKDFSCEENVSRVQIGLRHLVVPAWWLKKYNQSVADKHYRMDRVLALSFDNDGRSPYDKEVTVRISNITLHGRAMHYLWSGMLVLALTWIIYFIWLFWFYVSSLVHQVMDRAESNKPLMAYQKLSLEPHKDKTKNQLIHFMATEFANPDMSLDFVMNELGLTRNKINRLLKEELGLTFVAYLNKLRLAEAAKLLVDNSGRSIGDIAVMVGYNNISYFFRLFKEEFGCTPKKFVELYKSDESGE